MLTFTPCTSEDGPYQLAYSGGYAYVMFQWATSCWVNGVQTDGMWTCFKVKADDIDHARRLSIWHARQLGEEVISAETFILSEAIDAVNRRLSPEPA